MDYFFGFNYAQLKSPDFSSFHEAFIKLGGTGHIATQFPWFLPVRPQCWGEVRRDMANLNLRSS